jgi:DNA-binding transcriptional ArsR family regulator
MTLAPYCRCALAALNTDLCIDHLIVSRLYRRYLPELGFGFREMLIIGHLADGLPHLVSELESQLELDDPVLAASLSVLKDAGLIALRNTSALSVQLTRQALQMGAALLIVQANVDLDFGMASESIARIRRALLGLARKTRSSSYE